MSSVKETRPITQMVTCSHFVKQAEIKMIVFIIEHNLPFHVMDHLSDLLSNTSLDSKITLANVWKQMHQNMLHVKMWLQRGL